MESQIRRLLKDLQTVLPWEVVEEVTFECAPKAVTARTFRLLRALGVTRISLGVQQLNDAVLRANGRVHLVADVKRANREARDAGFDVVNLDLMVGMAGERCSCS